MPVTSKPPSAITKWSISPLVFTHEKKKNKKEKKKKKGKEKEDENQEGFPTVLLQIDPLTHTDIHTQTPTCLATRSTNPLRLGVE